MTTTRIDRRMMETVSRFSALGPKGMPFNRGISLENYQRISLLVDEDDLRPLAADPALDILQSIWEEGNYGAIQDRALAEEVFVFGCVFGDGVAAWLLEEAVEVNTMDRSYEMHTAPEGWTITAALCDRIAELGSDVLTNFRRLVAGYTDGRPGSFSVRILP